MPSKGKKNQKYSSPSQSPRTPSTPLSASSAGDDSLHHRHLLSALSSAHPSLLPSASSAFFGTIVESETSLSKGNRAVVYLSETAVVSSAFHPGSLVSVSLVSLDTQLDDSDVCTVADAGRQFSIATVFPSRYKRWSEAVLGPFLYNGFPYHWSGHIYLSPLHNFAHRQV